MANDSPEQPLPITAEMRYGGLLAASLLSFPSLLWYHLMDFSIRELSRPLFSISFFIVSLYLLAIFLPAIILFYYLIRLCFRPKTGKSFLRSITFIVSLQVFIFICGIVAENYLGSLQRKSQFQTLQKMDVISKAIERYKEMNYHYPVGHDLNALQSSLAPSYLQVLPADGWNNPYRYDSDSEGRKYFLYSIGGDGAMDVAHEAEYTECDTFAYESDIVISNGIFVREPIRKQSFRFQGGYDNNCYPLKRK